MKTWRELGYLRTVRPDPNPKGGIGRSVFGWFLPVATAASLAVSGCTTRGGWPRFLRPGEPTDAQLKKNLEEQQKKQNQ